ncbi:MAG TPA: hypothetical protein VMH49_06375 [Thermoplasmata archaeon]|nr:hypothetical protein [Thermoplasmata archaeon]
MEASDGRPWVAYPERLDRRMRLGPFASGRDLLKFLTAVAAGAVVGIAASPIVGAGIAASGTVVALWRPGGDPVDERLGAVARWGLRRLGEESSMTTGLAGPAAARAVALPDGRRVAFLRAGGVPLAYLPPADLARQFDGYRAALRAADGALLLHATAAPLHAGVLSPRGGEAAPAEREAREGYRELVLLLGRRRSLRQVYVGIVGEGGGTERGRRLETATTLLAERLGELGIATTRLEGRSLSEAARRLGLGPEHGGR